MKAIWRVLSVRLVAGALLLGSLLAQEAPPAQTNVSRDIPPCWEKRIIEYPRPMVQPRYPKESLKAGVEGSVELRAVVGSDGKTRELTVVKGAPVFATPAMQAARKWHFHSALVNGRPEETTYKVRVRFVLILKEAVTDLEIEAPTQEAPAGEMKTDFKFDTPEGPVYKVSKESGVIAPKVIYQRDPEFSEKARQAKEQGTVTVSLIVGTDGKPRNVKVECSSVPDLNENAVDAVKDWRFEPGTKDGKPVMVKLSADVEFWLYNHP